MSLRVRLDLGYDGTDFAGWAAQPGRRTVEGELSAALTTLLRAPEPVRLTVAGRTDAGRQMLFGVHRHRLAARSDSRPQQRRPLAGYGAAGVSRRARDCRARSARASSAG